MTNQAWVPVEHGLPDVGWVLTHEKQTSGAVHADKPHRVRCRWFRSDRKFVEPGIMADDGDLDCTPFVTHWMPLPKPPERRSMDDPEFKLEAAARYLANKEAFEKCLSLAFHKSWLATYNALREDGFDNSVDWVAMLDKWERGND